MFRKKTNIIRSDQYHPTNLGKIATIAKLAPSRLELKKTSLIEFQRFTTIPDLLINLRRKYRIIYENSK